MQRDDSIHERLADRLANILTKLNMGYQLSIKELASEFGVSTRTISRDFDRLNTYLPLLQDNETKKYGGVSKSMLTLNEAIIDVKEG